MLSIKRGIRIPSGAVDELAYADLPAALHWIHENSLSQNYEYLDRIQEIADEFPLLDGAEVEYWEARQEDLAASGISHKDRGAIAASFLANPCGVLLYPARKLILTCALRAMPLADQDMMIRHELVHLEQTVRGDALLVDEGQVWKGVLFPKEPLMNINGGLHRRDPHALYVYHTLPWEEEAYRRTEGDEAYAWKLAYFHLAHIINQALPEEHEYDPFLLANAAQGLFNDGCEFAFDGKLTASPSGEHLAKAYSSASLAADAIEGERAWQMVMKELGWQPDSHELRSTDDAWVALIDACIAVERLTALPAGTIRPPSSGLP